MIDRRRALALAALATLAAVPAAADTYPSKAVTFVVPWPAGGSSDLTMRALAEAASKHLGQPIVIENRAGASGTAGPAVMAASAKPDGYTVAQMPITVFRLPHMVKTSFDPAKDFTYILNVTGYTFGVVVKADAKWQTFDELMADAKANPGKISYGTPGAGTSLHITMEQIAAARGLKFTHVPFKGGAETNAAVMGGHVSAVADSTGWGALVDAKELRLLVTWGAERTRRWPDVPTLKELGYGIVSNSPFGIAGPKGMDPKVVKVLHDAFRKGMAEPVYAEAMRKFDMEPFYLSTADYDRFARETIEQERKLVDMLGLAKKS
ncbi:MAG: tripartite tricarboxylate transporter substrate binding protein [Alphaproteobacteria bacterium]|nr:tripartite tricarboxylate transporter substrate binding protein [Alphaproteobacteria bacterium]